MKKTFHVKCYVQDENRSYDVECTTLQEALDISEIFICQGYNPQITTL